MESVNTWLVRHPMVVDALLVLVLSPLVLGSTQAIATLHTADNRREVAGLAWGLAMLVPFLWRRAHPQLVAAIVAVGHVAYAALSQDMLPSLLLVPLALYGVAAWSDPARARLWLWLGLACAAYAGFHFTRPARPEPWASRAPEIAVVAFACASVVAAAWFMGRLARVRREAQSAVADRAAALERERAQTERLVASQERARIAREMHDVVAHSLSVIVVQADGGAYAAGHAVPDERLPTAARALDTIAATARTALAETRRLVGVLRSDDELELRPAASLARIPALVHELADAGFPVELRGPEIAVDDVPAEVQMAAYRVVQESLTNVLKHAGPGASATVTLARTADALDVGVADTGAGVRGVPDGAGSGLVGMRERVTALGGWLDAGAGRGGGFALTAHIPLAAAPERTAP